MRKLCTQGALVALLFASSGAGAQETATPQQTPQAGAPAPGAPVDNMAVPVDGCVVDPPNANTQQGAPEASAQQQQQQETKKKGSLGKDVGGASGATAGQIAGAAVGGPIGAAAVGVVGERIGRAIGSVLKGDGKKKERREGQEQAAATPPTQCAPQQGSGGPGGL